MNGSTPSQISLVVPYPISGSQLLTSHSNGGVQMTPDYSPLGLDSSLWTALDNGNPLLVSITVGGPFFLGLPQL